MNGRIAAAASLGAVAVSRTSHADLTWVMAGGPEIEIVDEQELQPLHVLDPNWGHRRNVDRDRIARTGILGAPFTVDALREPLRSVARRYRHYTRRHIGAPNPRNSSDVGRHVWVPSVELVGLLDEAVRNGLPNSRMDIATDGLHYDRHSRAFRVRAALHVPWCSTRFPTWLGIVPWWRNRSVLHLSLRTTRRWHYPMRYFAAAHFALEDVTRSLGLPTGPASLGTLQANRPDWPTPVIRRYSGEGR